MALLGRSAACHGCRQDAALPVRNALYMVICLGLRATAHCGEAQLAACPVPGRHIAGSAVYKSLARADACVGNHVRMGLLQRALGTA